MKKLSFAVVLLSGCLSSDLVCDGWLDRLHDGQARYNAALWKYQTQCYGRDDRDTKKCGKILDEELSARQTVLDMQALGNTCENQSSKEQFINRCPTTATPNACE